MASRRGMGTLIMTQFASTLYPQTNPSNPILLNFRGGDGKNGSRRPMYLRCHHWLEYLNSPLMGAWEYATPVQVAHAKKVLTRLASFSG